MLCANCNNELADDSRFCKHCGVSQVVIAGEEDSHRSILSLLSLFYGIELTACLLMRFVDELQAFRYYLVFDIVTAVTTVIFIAFCFRDVKEVLKWNNFSVKRLLIYIAIALVASLVVQFLVRLLNRSLFEEDYYYYFAFSATNYPVLFMLLSIALQPALIEELGFRGFIMSQLNKIMDEKQVIFISAFVFALIHLSIFSMLWILPFAVLLGYIRQKENTIWYGVVIHFVFNATACIVELLNLRIV